MNASADGVGRALTIPRQDVEERVKRDIKKVIEAIKAGYAGAELKAEMDDLYRSKVEEPASALQREDTRLQASEMLRGLIDSILLIPEDGQLRIELRGNLAAMLTAAQQTKRSPETGDLIVPVQMVAGLATN